MTKGIIIHLDNDRKGILEVGENLFKQMDINLELILCENKVEFEKVVTTRSKEIKCLIFDLHSKDPSEEQLNAEQAEFLENVEKTFATLNIPIFIYSGYLQSVETKFNSHGTVFKIDKKESIKTIFDKIKLFFDSGFINIFSPGGILETELHKDLHNAFIKQFNNSTQIESIIKQIISTQKDEMPKRVEKVFKRIAIRSLLTALSAPETDEQGNIINMEFANSIEHYLQRINGFEFWTGDIWKKNDAIEHLLIITPRCNVAKQSYTELLVCDVSPEDFPKKVESNNDKGKIVAALTDNPHASGYDRYLPPSPIFKGGKVLLSTYKTIKKDILRKEYTRVISLSEELTNEILGKFGAYFFRTGIMPWSEEEMIAQVKDVSSIQTESSS